MADRFDIAIIGGGHNGLVAASYLARAGRRVVVLERRSSLGGAAAVEEIAPGFRVPAGATFAGLLRPEIVRDLGLAGHGFEVLPFDPLVTSVDEDGRVLRMWRDLGKTQQEIAKFSPKDAESYGRFHAFMLQIARLVDPLMLRTPPNVKDLTRGEQVFLLRLALRARRLGKQTMGQAVRFPQMALRASLPEWFESELLMATLAVDALIGRSAGPFSPGTSFGLLQRYLPEVHGNSWTFVRGGMASLTDALARAAQGAGATLRTDASVARIVTEDGRATGVQLESGETISARVVASSADPKRTFLGLLDHSELDLEFRNRVLHTRTEGGLAKINLALSSIPDMKNDGPAPPRLRFGPTLEYLERAYDDAKYGRSSANPYLDVAIPSLADPSLAPSGQHVMSVLAQFAPYRLRRGSWKDEREKFAERVVGRLEELLPGIRKATIARQVLTPVDLEEKFSLSGGHIYHGEMSLDQQFILRPIPGWARYRTPIAGLYLCGSGTHPGGGITGAPGYNAAREILKDWTRRAG